MLCFSLAIRGIMKIPKSPPNTDKTLARLKDNPSLTSKLFNIKVSPLVDGKYLHWDKFRFYDRPEGISSEDWWFAVKTQRRNLYKELPLKDICGTPFQYLSIETFTEILHEIDSAAVSFNQMPDDIKNNDTKNRFYVNTLIQEAFTSSKLEGAATTRKIAKEMIQTGRRPVDKSEQMILNNFEAMKQIEMLRNEPLSKKMIFEIHRLVTNKTLKGNSGTGRFRKPSESIAVYNSYNDVLHEPPAAEQLNDRMKAMCIFANDKKSQDFIHPVIRSIILHFWLAYDHPFVDGNGRTARALFYWSMLRHGYWLFEFVSISQIIVRAPAKYGRAFLYTETDENDLTYFIVYHLEIIRRAIEELHKYIDRKTKQLQKLESQLRGISILNFRQRTLISHALKHPKQKYTINSHKISHNVVYQTARTDMLDLQKRGLLDMIKIGKTQYFSAANDLEKKLTELTC